MDPWGTWGVPRWHDQLERCKLLIQWEPPGWSYHNHHCKWGMVENTGRTLEPALPQDLGREQQRCTDNWCNLQEPSMGSCPHIHITPWNDGGRWMGQDLPRGSPPGATSMGGEVSTTPRTTLQIHHLPTTGAGAGLGVVGRERARTIVREPGVGPVSGPPTGISYVNGTLGLHGL